MILKIKSYKNHSSSNYLAMIIILRVRLVPNGVQNAKCQLLCNDEMQNTKIFRVMFSFI
jgi:hypothetical protein